MYMFRDLEMGLNNDLKMMVNEVCKGQTLVQARGDTDVQIVRYAWRKGENESNNLAACFPQDS